MRRATGSEDTRQTSNRTAGLTVLLVLILIFAAQIATLADRVGLLAQLLQLVGQGSADRGANGQVTYYTDLGNLSAQVTQAQANAMVATAAAVWGNVKTATVMIQRGGALAEDVNGSNVTVGASGVILPADIQPTATSKPVAVVTMPTARYRCDLWHRSEFAAGLPEQCRSRERRQSRNHGQHCSRSCPGQWLVRNQCRPDRQSAVSADSRFRPRAGS